MTCRTRDIDRRLLALVSFCFSLLVKLGKSNGFTDFALCVVGSGCIAALEAEKWLGEQELDSVAIEEKNSAHMAAPEYKSNPLL